MLKIIQLLVEQVNRYIDTSEKKNTDPPFKQVHYVDSSKEYSERQKHLKKVSGQVMTVTRN